MVVYTLKSRTSIYKVHAQMTSKHAHMSEENLWQSVKMACDQTKTNARLVKHTNGKIYIFDCPKWSNHVASIFKFQHPNAIICVEQASSSLSGFVLIIEEKKTKHVTYRIWASLMATFVVYIFLWILYENQQKNSGSNNNNEAFMSFFLRFLLGNNNNNGGGSSGSNNNNSNEAIFMNKIIHKRDELR